MAVTMAFPHLDHFLNAYMHQDWDLFGESLEEVLQTYARQTSRSDVDGLRAEIDQFIASKGTRIESDYYELYPNSVAPSGWNMNVEQWLRRVSELAARASNRM
jgi:hypothetical protein